MAKAKTTTKPPKKATPKKGTVKSMEAQPQIAGMEDEKNPRVHGPALTYADVRDRRNVLTKEEKAAKQALIEVMHKEGITRYKYRELVVDMTSKGDDVKVRVEAAGAAEGGDE